MLCYRIFLIVIVTIVSVRYVKCNEPKCTSKFDYDYKMLQKMVELDGKLQTLDEKLRQQQALIDKMSTDGAGAVYVRWGKAVCPEDSDFIYSGYIAGKYHSEKGSGSNSLCLASDPSWFNYTEGVDEWRGRVYGAETDVPDILAYSVSNQDMPCSVCKTHKSAVLMIPGRTTCYPSLRLEYSGYLMSSYHNHHGPHNYICVDTQPDFVPHGSSDNNQHVLYLVESICGSLPCPPYVHGRELACVVCSI